MCTFSWGVFLALLYIDRKWEHFWCKISSKDNFYSLSAQVGEVTVSLIVLQRKYTEYQLPDTMVSDFYVLSHLIFSRNAWSKCSPILQIQELQVYWNYGSTFIQLKVNNCSSALSDPVHLRGLTGHHAAPDN